MEAETSITHFTKEEVSEESWDDVCDGERLYYKLEKIFENNDLDLEEEIKIVKDYLNSLDTYVDVKVRVKKSNREILYGKYKQSNGYDDGSVL